MMLSLRDLIGLPVQTESGDALGRVVGGTLDGDSGIVIRYRVRPRGIAAVLAFGDRDLTIAHGQVRSIDTSKMIVEDADIVDTDQQRASVLGASKQPQPIATATEIDR
jgi:sporulation protein YlmC with PRC-barrel domain